MSSSDYHRRGEGGPSSHPQEKYRSQHAQRSFGFGGMHEEYDSNEDVQAALQLSFDSHSPESHSHAPHHKDYKSVERQHQQRRQHIHRDRNSPSPTKKSRASRSESHHHHTGGGSDSEERYQQHPQPQQQQHEQGYPPFNPYYPYGPPGSQGPPPPPPPGYPGGPPLGYPGHQSQHQWPPGLRPAQGPGFGWHPQYQQQQQPPPPQHQPPPTPTGSRPKQQQRTPASKRKGGRNPKVDTTMETAELSYEDEHHIGLMSPPSSKKRRDRVGLSASYDWGSPPLDFARGVVSCFISLSL